MAFSQHRSASAPHVRGDRSRRVIAVGMTAAAVVLGGGGAVAVASTAHAKHHPRSHGRAPAGVIGVSGVDTTPGAFSHTDAVVVQTPTIKTAGTYYFQGQVQVAMGDQDQFICTLGNLKSRKQFGVESAAGKFTPSATSTTTFQSLALVGEARLSKGAQPIIACEDTIAGQNSAFYFGTLTGTLVTDSRSASNRARAFAVRSVRVPALPTVSIP